MSTVEPAVRTARATLRPRAADLTIDLTVDPTIWGTVGSRVRALVIESDPLSVGAAAKLLRRSGFQTSCVASIDEAIRELHRTAFDVVLVDASHHHDSATSACRAVRSEFEIPICVVSPGDDELDVVLALELGADVVLRKPVRPRELIARLLALVRRSAPQVSAEERINVGDVDIDLSRHEARVRGRLVDLTMREFMLLTMFLQHAGRALTKELLVTRLWGSGEAGSNKALASHVHRLREIIEVDPDNPTRLITIRGYGYRYLV